MFEEFVRSSWFFYGGLVYVSATIVYVTYKITNHFETTNKRLKDLEEKTS